MSCPELCPCQLRICTKLAPGSDSLIFIMRSLFRTFIYLLCLGIALGTLEIRHRWDTGYEATLHMHIDQETHGWHLVLGFDRAVEALEVWAAEIESEVNNQAFILVNIKSNPDFPPNTDFPLKFLVRHASGGAVPTLAEAAFNGKSIGVGTYDYSDVLGKSLLFYEAQRTGKLPAENRIPWRGDSFLQDGRDNGLDLTGGYFDAGDHVKFGFPMAAMTTIIGWGLIDNREGYVAAGELANCQAALRWSLDYFIKAHPSPNVLYGQVGDGDVDHAYWGRPEEWPASSPRPSWKITEFAPGTDLAAETAAAFVTGYLVFRDSDASYAAECLRHARELYAFANTYRGNYTDAIPNAASFYQPRTGYGDELGWAAAWLYRATRDERYMNDVRTHFSDFHLSWMPWGFSWDDKTAGVQILLAQITDDPQYKTQAEKFCNFTIYEIPRSPKGLTILSEWGSLRSVSSCVFVCLLAADAGINADTYRAFARSQINYILGDTGRSYVVGYGVNPPTRPHHRASSCPSRPAVCDLDSARYNPGPNFQTLTGALVGGPGAQDNYEDDRGDYVKNEVAIDYNSGFQGALAALVKLQAQGKIH